MTNKRIYTAIGLMSGTSMDGIDLALIRSDGYDFIDSKKFSYLSYQKDFKLRLSNIIHGSPNLLEIKEFERDLTLMHADFVEKFLADNNIKKSDIDAVAFHGHTILHAPDKSVTWQIGNPDLLASRLGIDIVSDFRNRDVAFMGQGAPLVPIYHLYLSYKIPKPLAILNIGGISNITYLPNNNESDMEAFDVCFGNAPFDDLVKKYTGQDFDQDGQIAASGNIETVLSENILLNEIFYKNPPKSFDRDDFASILKPFQKLRLQDALASLAYIHAKIIDFNIKYLAKGNSQTIKIFVCGGGRKNKNIIEKMVKFVDNAEILPIENIGFNGDSIEAEAFAFLAIRRILDLPISFQKTTGVLRGSNSSLALSRPHSSSCGGVFYRA